MGITKRAVTVIGLRVHRDKISHIVDDIQNYCTCSPKTLESDDPYCSKCGSKINVPYKRRVLKDIVDMVTEDPGWGPVPYVAGYQLVGSWHHDEHVFIACVESSTEAAYSAEGADPVKTEFPVGQDRVMKFMEDMMECGLWDEEEFGIWTIMLVE